MEFTVIPYMVSCSTRFSYVFKSRPAKTMRKIFMYHVNITLMKCKQFTTIYQVIHNQTTSIVVTRIGGYIV